MARFYMGVFFPADFFHSNIGYAEAYGQVLAGSVLRASGPFTEPSGLAYHFAGFLLFAWYRYLQRPSRPGSIAIVIPPSIAMILYGASAEQSIPELFEAGLVPGLLIAALMMLYIAVAVRRSDLGTGAPFALTTWSRTRQSRRIVAPPDRSSVMRSSGMSTKELAVRAAE